MKNKRVQALLAQLEQVRIELGAEFKFMETTCDDQLKELKQLRFEAMGNSPQEDLFETRVITYEALNEILSNEVTNPAVSKAILDHFDALTLKGVPYVLKPHHATDLRCEDMHDYMIDYEEPDPVLEELILEGTIDGKPLPFEVIAQENVKGNEITAWIDHFCSMGRTLAFADARNGDYFDTILWRWVAIVDVHAGVQS